MSHPHNGPQKSYTSWELDGFILAVVYDAHEGVLGSTIVSPPNSNVKADIFADC